MIFESYTSKGVPKKALFFYFGFSVGYAILFIGRNKGRQRRLNEKNKKKYSGGERRCEFLLE